MKKHRFDDVYAYRKWVKQRDRALEQIHTNAQLRSADILRDVFGRTLMTCASYYHAFKHGGHGTHELEEWTKRLFRDGADQLYVTLIRMRTKTYTLAKASEAEIIAQMTKRPIKSKVDRADLDKVKIRPSLAGGPLLARIQLYMDRLRRKVVSYAQSSALIAPDAHAFLIDVCMAFPKRRMVRQPRRILKPKLMEAIDAGPRGGIQADSAIDFVDDQEWQSMLDDYMNDYVPKSREPEYVVDIPITDPTIQATTGEEVWYAWEFERDMTNEFVKDVRDGQIDAANENGITDFVWIAVIDSKTDDCCAWRDGLLTSEIEAKVDDHSDEDDECGVEGDGINPPIHFNCRCTLAPATDEIPDKPDDGAKEFDDWLMS